MQFSWPNQPKSKSDLYKGLATAADYWYHLKINCCKISMLLILLCMLHNMLYTTVTYLNIIVMQLANAKSTTCDSKYCFLVQLSLTPYSLFCWYTIGMFWNDSSIKIKAYQAWKCCHMQFPASKLTASHPSSKSNLSHSNRYQAAFLWHYTKHCSG